MIPVAECVLLERVDRQAHVLPGAGQVGELQVHHSHAVLLRHLEHVLGRDIRLAGEGADRQRLVAGDQFADRGLLWCSHGPGLIPPGPRRCVSRGSIVWLV
jgi:hypothetical protein